MLDVIRVKGELRCMNIYDIRLDDVVPACGMNWPPDLVDIGTYLKVSLSSFQHLGFPGFGLIFTSVVVAT